MFDHLARPFRTATTGLLLSYAYLMIYHAGPPGGSNDGHSLAFDAMTEGLRVTVVASLENFSC